MVSVIIPTFKGISTLGRSIDSVINQSYSDYEIIIVDDNYPDSYERKKTEEIVRKYLQYENVSYIKHKDNRNGSCARNTGIKNARGKYISFLDDDDVYHEDRLKKLVEEAEKTDLDAVFSKVIVKNNETVLRKANVRLVEDNFYNLFVNENLLGTGSNIFIKKEIAEKVNGFDERLVRNQDYDFLLSFFLKGYKAKTIDEVLVIKYEDIQKNIPKYDDLKNIKKYLYEKYKEKISTYSNYKQRKIIRSIHNSLLESAIYNNHWDGIVYEVRKMNYLIPIKKIVKILIIKFPKLVFIKRTYYKFMNIM